MGDLELLFVVLAVIYGWECLCWMGHGSTGFRTWLGRHWRIVRPSSLFGNQRGGFLFAHPAPPLGTLLSSTALPGEDLRAFALLPSAKRAPAMEELAQARLDVKAARDRWLEFQQLTAGLKLLTNGLFGFLFILAPALLWNFGVRVCWPGLVAVLLAFTISTAVLFGKAHRRLYPEAEEKRFTHFLTILLSPATTIRARDVLSRPLLEKFHPLTVAKLVCDEHEFCEFARKSLRGLRHSPSTPGLNEDPAKALEREWREVSRKAIEGFLKQHGLEPENLMRAPTPADESCRSYCPRCLAQFTTPTGQCDDCGGIRLVGFAVGETEPGLSQRKGRIPAKTARSPSNPAIQ
jgi:hypothetical protein